MNGRCWIRTMVPPTISSTIVPLQIIDFLTTLKAEAMIVKQGGKRGLSILQEVFSAGFMSRDGISVSPMSKRSD